MSDRKREILQMAIEIIEDEGYGSLSMRGLARASGMKLGALQYHFRTWEDMLRALVDHIDTELSEGFQQQVDDSGSPSVLEIAAYMLDESGQGSLFTDRLWPQLWAMEQVEPLVSDLLEDVYAEYLRLLEQALVEKGVSEPRAEALCMMSLMEGESLFTGGGRRWESDKQAVRDTILALIKERYGE
ncbi:MAG: TetR/AcrR family transcriptional regulator [Halieaceae bacterium]|jgi:AcrR family transcriptional regulator|nr:TetR/AcrR family transcriptional regulator [Halieaceae bacterium]